MRRCVGCMSLGHADGICVLAHAQYSGAQVCGVHGSWHLGQLQIGLSRPIKLAQCRSARITLLEAIPVQMDGEPWRQPPATLDVSLHGQVPPAPPPL